MITGPSEGHAHLIKPNSIRTEVTNDHWHEVIQGSNLTGPAVPVGEFEPEPGGHRHSIPTATSSMSIE